MKPASMRLLLLGFASLLSACGASDPPREGGTRLVTPSGSEFVGSPNIGRPSILVMAREARHGTWRALGGANVSGLSLSAPRRDDVLELWVAGCRPVVVPWPLPKQVKLEEGIPVRLTVTVDGGLPEAPLHVGMEARWHGPGDLPEAPALVGVAGAGPRGWLDVERRYETVDPTLRVDAEHPSVEATFSRPGPHLLRWTVWQSTNGVVSYGTGPSDPGVVIQVEDRRGGPPQEIEVRLDAASLRSVMPR